MENQKNKKVTIIVNTREKEWDKKEEISYEEIIVLTYGSYTDNDTTIYTVTYKKGIDSKKEGSLTKGESVKVKDGMIFNVTQTNKS